MAEQDSTDMLSMCFSLSSWLGNKSHQEFMVTTEFLFQGLHQSKQPPVRKHQHIQGDNNTPASLPRELVEILSCIPCLSCKSAQPEFGKLGHEKTCWEDVRCDPCKIWTNNSTSIKLIDFAFFFTLHIKRIYGSGH